MPDRPELRRPQRQLHHAPDGCETGKLKHGTRPSNVSSDLALLSDRSNAHDDHGPCRGPRGKRDKRCEAIECSRAPSDPLLALSLAPLFQVKTTVLLLARRQTLLASSSLTSIFVHLSVPTQTTTKQVGSQQRVEVRHQVANPRLFRPLLVVAHPRGTRPEAATWVGHSATAHRGEMVWWRPLKSTRVRVVNLSHCMRHEGCTAHAQRTRPRQTKCGGRGGRHTHLCHLCHLATFPAHLWPPLARLAARPPIPSADRQT